MARLPNAFVPVLSLLLILTGCAVPYSEVGDRGGHSTSPLGNDQFEVTYRSNSSGQPSTRMRELVLLRAAEVTLEYGYTHFVVEDELEDVHTKWGTTSTTRTVGGPLSTGGGGIGIGGPSGGIGIGGSTGGIGIGSPTIGTGGRTGTVTSSTPVPIAIPELTLRIRCHRGTPTTAYKGDLYDAARLRDILAVKYGIDVGGEPPPSRQAPKIQVIE